MDTPRIPPPSVSKLVWKIIEVHDGAPKANKFRGSFIAAKAEDCKAKTRHGLDEVLSKGLALFGLIGCNRSNTDQVPSSTRVYHHSKMVIAEAKSIKRSYNCRDGSEDLKEDPSVKTWRNNTSVKT